jgi:outer membrane protein assembly factor BamB
LPARAVAVGVHRHRGLSGGPAVAADGTLYIGGLSATLYALSPSGALRWQASLSARPVRVPALGADGTVYVVDERGGLSAFAPDGTALWHVAGSPPGNSSPITGPDGVVYYLGGGAAIAVAPDGTPLWSTKLGMNLDNANPPRLTADGTHLLVQAVALRVRDGTREEQATLDGGERLFVGADGRNYFSEANVVTHWRGYGAAAVAVGRTTWEWRRFTVGYLRDAGATQAPTFWLYYITDYEDGRLVWLDGDNRMLGMARFPHRGAGRVIAVDGVGVAYTCGRNRESGPECLAFEQGQATPLWQLSLPGGERVIGGALVPERLYVALAEGMLYAIGP